MMRNFTQLLKKTSALSLLLAMGYSAMAADTTPPVIDLKTKDTVKVQIGSVYISVNPKITDNQSDSASIVVSKTNGLSGGVNAMARGWYAEIYSATDSNNNKSSKTRYILVDDFIPPTINLNTASTVYHKWKTPYTPVTPTATDNYYPSNQVSLVKISSDVDVNVIGTYQDVYEATDGSGNKTRVIRIVIVEKQASLNNLANSTVKLFPNPANDNFMVSLASGLSETNIEIYSMHGRVVYSEAGVRNGTLVDIGALDTGVYTVMMKFGSMTMYTRLLIER